MIEWVGGKYSSYSADLGHGLRLAVSYEGVTRLEHGAPTWNVYVFGCQLKNRSASLEEARARAEKIAKNWLTQALEKLVSTPSASPERKPGDEER